MSAGPPDRDSGNNPPTITASVAGVFAGFGILVAIGLGWTLARSVAGQPPFQLATGPGGAVTLSAASAEPPTLTVAARDISFENKTLNVAGPGLVNFVVSNTGAIEHDFTIDIPKVKIAPRPGQRATGAVTFEKPGTYSFYCSLPGHREAGMEGKLIVGTGAGLSSKVEAASSAAPAAPTPTMVSHASSATPPVRGNQPIQPVMDGGVKVFSLTASVVQWEIIPGVFSEAWAYNGQVPGPVIRVGEGDRVRVTIKNQLPDSTVIHFHGPELPNSMDGVPDVTQPAIPVGGSFTYEFKATPAGTYIYHTHQNSAVQEPKGLMGALIIDPAPGSAEAVRDAKFDRDYLQVLGEFGGYFIMNGHSFPATDVMEAKVGERVRIRLINAGQAAHPMHLHGYHFKVIGTDGRPLPEGAIYLKDTLNISPGERYDIEFVADNPGVWVFHCHILSHVTNQGVDPGGMIAVIKVV
jgi:FtsP/CotA-like multicopper oxidase with cupredoxin domain